MNEELVEEKTNEQEGELNKCLTERDEYLNGWKRAQADFLNYKNEESKRVENFAKFANESLIKEFLEVMDNIEMVISSATDDIKDKNKNWFVGLEQTVRQFESILNKYGVKRIKVDNNDFDPNYHEVIGTENGDEDRIEEIRAGYTMNDKVIRPTRVKIIKKK